MRVIAEAYSFPIWNNLDEILEPERPEIVTVSGRRYDPNRFEHAIPKRVAEYPVTSTEASTDLYRPRFTPVDSRPDNEQLEYLAETLGSTDVPPHIASRLLTHISSREIVPDAVRQTPRSSGKKLNRKALALSKTR